MLWIWQYGPTDCRTSSIDHRKLFYDSRLVTALCSEMESLMTSTYCQCQFSVTRVPYGVAQCAFESRVLVIVLMNCAPCWTAEFSQICPTTCRGIFIMGMACCRAAALAWSNLREW